MKTNSCWLLLLDRWPASSKTIYNANWLLNKIWRCQSIYEMDPVHTIMPNSSLTSIVKDFCLLLVIWFLWDSLRPSCLSMYYLSVHIVTDSLFWHLSLHSVHDCRHFLLALKIEPRASKMLSMHSTTDNSSPPPHFLCWVRTSLTSWDWLWTHSWAKISNEYCLSSLSLLNSLW